MTLLRIEHATDIHAPSGVLITGTVNYTKGFGIVQVFAGGVMVKHEYTSASMPEVREAMKRAEGEVAQ